MEEIRLWITSIAVSSILITTIGVLLPKGTTGKTVKILTAVVFLTIILLPFMNGKIDIDIGKIGEEFTASESIKDTEEKIADELITTAENAVKNEITKMLEERLILVQKIEVSAEKNQDGEIAIKEIFISASNLKNVSETGKEIEEKYKCEVKIVSSEE